MDAVGCRVLLTWWIGCCMACSIARAGWVAEGCIAVVLPPLLRSTSAAKPARPPLLPVSVVCGFENSDEDGLRWAMEAVVEEGADEAEAEVKVEVEVDVEVS